MKKKVLVWMLSVCMVLTMMPLPAFAETGTESEGNVITVAAGESIQAAIDVAEDGDVIKLSNDTTENVTVTQKPDVKITIDGNNMTMKGSITVDGKSKAYETAGLTIKNVKFDATNITTEACINLGVSGDNNTRYTRNITVENCTFTGADKVKAAIKSYTGGDKNLKVIGCTVDNTMHSLLQADNITGVVIDGCTVNSKNGINLNSSENVEIKNSTVEVNGYAVRIGASSGGGSGKVELSNNTLKTDDSEGDAVIVLRGVASSLVDLDMAENIISGETHISGVAADTNINADANYWDGEEAPTVIGTPVKVDSYYPDESKDTLTIVGKTAKINENLYDSLDAAIDAAINGDTITLINDCSENVTVEQKPDVKITIDGNNKSFTGTITVDGKSAAYPTAGITIKNVNFDAANIADTCIMLGDGTSATRYTSNVTIENCTFTDTVGIKAKVGIKSYTGGDKNLAVIGCTATNMHSLLQIKNIEGVQISGCEVTDSKNGISVGVSSNVEISDTQIATDGYGIRADGASGADMTIEGCTVESEQPVVVRKTTGDYELTVTSGTYTPIGEGKHGIVFTGGDDGDTLVEPTGNVNSNISESVVTKIYPDADYVAKLNGKKYLDLQAAIDAAIAGDNTIELMADVDKDVTIKQLEGINIIIDGNDKTYTYSGTVTIHGNARYDGAETLMFRNIKFKTSEAGHYFIDSNSTAAAERYAHNVTVEGCEFIAEDAAVKSAVGMRIRQGFNIAVKNSTAIGLHSLMQLYGNNSVVVEDVEITGGKNGIAVGTSTGVTVSNATIEAEGYGIRADGEGAYDMTATDCTITANDPIVVRKAKGNYELNVTGGSLTATNAGGYGVVFTNGDDGTYDEPTGNFISNIDESVETKVYPISEYAVEVNGKSYVSLQKAIDAAGENDVVKVISDITLEDGVDIKAGKNVTLDLNGKTISGTHGADYSMIHVLNGAELTVDDTSTEQNGKITCAAGGNNTGANIWVEGKLTLDSGTIEVTGTWNLGFAVDLRPNAWGTAYTVGASFIMNGGTVKSTDTAVRIASNSSDSHDELGVTFTMNNGTIESSWDAIFVQHLYKGDLDINVVDGNVSGDNSAVRIYGDAGSDIDIAVENGNFNGKFKVADAYADADAIKISGGTYDTDVSAYLADGYVLQINNGGTYGVIKKADATDLPYLYTDTETGVTYYSDNKDALAEALGIGAENISVNTVYLEQQIEDLKAALKDAENSSASEKAALEKQIEDLKAEIAELSKENKLAVPVAKASNIASTGKIKVTWNAVEGADEYALYRATTKDGSYEKILTITGTSYTDTSAKAGKTYYYKVKALTDNKSVNNSELSEAVMRTCDLPRASVKASNVASTGKVKLTWKKISGAEQYKVYRSTSKSGKYTLMKTVSGTSYTNTSATAGKAYYYKIVAVDKDNTAANSAYSVVVKRTCDLKQPVVTATSTVKSQVKLTWKKVEGAKNYVVYRATSSNGKYIKITTTTKVSYTNKSLKSGKTYYYKVRAISENSAANSAYSTVDKCKAR